LLSCQRRETIICNTIVIAGGKALEDEGKKREQAKTKYLGNLYQQQNRHFQAVTVYLSFVIKIVPVGNFIDCHSGQNKGEDMNYNKTDDTIRFNFRNNKHNYI